MTIIRVESYRIERTQHKYACKGFLRVPYAWPYRESIIHLQLLNFWDADKWDMIALRPRHGPLGMLAEDD